MQENEIEKKDLVKVCPRCEKHTIFRNKTKKIWICYGVCKKDIRKTSEYTFKKPLEKPRTKFITKKRDPNQMDLINQRELINRIKNMETPGGLRDQALVAFLYLTGARVSEVVSQVKKEQIIAEKIEGIWHIVVYNVPVLKRRKLIKRTIPILVTKKEHEIVEFLARYLQSQVSETDYLWDFKRNWAGQIVRSGTGLFPHFLRHLRLTHLVTEYSFGAPELTQFTGWTDFRPATHYVHLDWKNIAKKIREAAT